MELKNYNVYFFMLIMVIISVATYFIFQPFLIAILLAAIFAVIFQKPYRFFLKITGNRKRISAFFTSLVGVVIFMGLFVAIAGIVIGEASSIYQNATAGGDIYQKYVDPVFSAISKNPVLKSFGAENLINKDTIAKSFSQIGQVVLSFMQKTYQSVADFIFLSIVMFFTLYYFLISGKDVVSKIMYLSPLKNSHEKILIGKFISISRAMAKGALIIALIQGAIGAVTFSLLGLPSAFVLAVAMMFFSLIPMVGSGLVWLPAALFMFLTGNAWKGIIILIVGFGIISTIDNFIRPKLVGKDIEMHPLMVLFATLGGISLFGILGFIIGPIIVALFLTLWDIYAVEFKSQLKKYNA